MKAKTGGAVQPGEEGAECLINVYKYLKGR